MNPRQTNAERWMENRQFKLYFYRWVVLAVFVFVNLTIQILWISYAPITGPAAEYYGVDDIQIGLLAMSFMIAFIPLSIPVSWVIDTYGFRLAVGIGVVLMGVFGLLRGLAGQNYSIVFWCTIGIAVAQPFLLNAWTTVPAKWFALEERATAVGIVTLGNLLGTGIGMVLTPLLLNSMTIDEIQLIYGGIAAFSAILFLVLARETPPTPPCPQGQEVRALVLEGLRHALKVKDFWLYLFIVFVGMGLFNGLTTWVEAIIRPRGFSPSDAGTLGALMLVGGLLGAVIIPMFSDRQKKRKKFLLLGFALAIPALLGLTYLQTSLGLFISSFVLGFFLVSVFPVGMQYAAEITHPTPEGTSNGLVQLCGQGAVVFVYLMEVMRAPDGSFTPSLLLSVFLLVVCLFVITRMNDPYTRISPAD
jgi:MFS family permease